MTHAGSADTAPGFALVSRADCHLCEVMLEELSEFLGGETARIIMIDVDAHEDLRRRFSYKVPVLLHDGEVVCHGRFDRAAVERVIRSAAWSAARQS